MFRHHRLPVPIGGVSSVPCPLLARFASTAGLRRCCLWPKGTRSVKPHGAYEYSAPLYSAGRHATSATAISRRADRPRHGRPRLARALTPRRLAAALQRDPRACGFGATSWTVPLLTRYLREHGHLALSPRTLRRRLHESGFRWKRPRYVYRGRAPHLGQKKGGYAAGCKPVSSRVISCSLPTGRS
jgi:transposase